MTWNDLGPLVLRAADADGRRYPCGCCTAPAAWMLMAPKAFPRKGVVFVSVPLPTGQPEGFPFGAAFENALDSLVDYVERERTAS